MASSDLRGQVSIIVASEIVALQWSMIHCFNCPNKWRNFTETCSSKRGIPEWPRDQLKVILRVNFCLHNQDQLHCTHVSSSRPRSWFRALGGPRRERIESRSISSSIKRHTFYMRIHSLKNYINSMILVQNNILIHTLTANKMCIISVQIRKQGRKLESCTTTFPFTPCWASVSQTMMMKRRWSSVRRTEPQ